MIKYDCGLTDAEHSEWQAWLDIYDLTMNLHDSVSDITSFIHAYSQITEEEYGMTEVSDDIYALFKPALKLLQKANTKIRSKYGIAEKNNSLPDNRPDISR